MPCNSDSMKYVLTHPSKIFEIKTQTFFLWYLLTVCLLCELHCG